MPDGIIFSNVFSDLDVSKYGIIISNQDIYVSTLSSFNNLLCSRNAIPYIETLTTLTYPVTTVPNSNNQVVYNPQIIQTSSQKSSISSFSKKF